MSLGFEIPTVQMEPPSFRKDKSVKVSFATGEMDATQKMAVLENEGSLGTVIFIPEEVQDQPPKLTAEYEGKKPSQRLYNVMYVYFKQQGSTGNFEQYYASQMEKLINAYKEKLDQ